MKIRIVPDNILRYNPDTLNKLFINFKLPTKYEIDSEDKTLILLNKASRIVSSLDNKYKHKTYDNYKLKLTITLILYSLVGNNKIKDIGSASDLFDKIIIEKTPTLSNKGADDLYEVIDNIYDSITLEKVDILRLFRNKTKVLYYCNDFFENITNNKDELLITKTYALNRTKEFLLEPKDIINRLFKSNDKLIQDIRSYVFSIDTNNPVNSGQNYNNEINTYVLLGLIVNRLAKNRSERYNRKLAITRCFYLTHLFKNLDLLEKGDTTSLGLVLNYVSVIDIREKFVINKNDCEVLNNYITKSEKFSLAHGNPMHFKHFKYLVLSNIEHFLEVFSTKQETVDFEKMYFDRLLDDNKINVNLVYTSSKDNSSRKLEVNYSKNTIIIESTKSVLIDKYIGKVISSFRVPIKYTKDIQGLEKQLKSLEIIVSSFGCLKGNEYLNKTKLNILFYTLAKIIVMKDYGYNYENFKSVFFECMKYKLNFTDIPKLTNKNNELVYNILYEMTDRINLYLYDFRSVLNDKYLLYNCLDNFYYKRFDLDNNEIIIKSDFTKTINNFNYKIKTNFNMFVVENKDILSHIEQRLSKGNKFSAQQKLHLYIVSYLLSNNENLAKEEIDYDRFLNYCIYLFINNPYTEIEIDTKLFDSLYKILIRSKIYDKFKINEKSKDIIVNYTSVMSTFIPSTIVTYSDFRDYYNNNLYSFYNCIKAYEEHKEKLQKRQNELLIDTIKQESKNISSSIKQEKNYRLQKLELSDKVKNPDISAIDFK